MNRLPVSIRTVMERKATPFKFNPDRPTTGPADQQLQDMLARVESSKETSE